MKYLILLSMIILEENQLYAQPCTAENSLVSIRTVKSVNTEDLVFTFKKPMSSTVKASSASGPFSDYSGKTVKVNGDHFKKIRFESVDWMCNTKIYVNLPSSLIADIKETERFEGSIEYIIGLKPKVGFIKQYSTETAGYKKIIFRFRKS